jgi:membrane fusion protein (multidrug efflux system)
MPDDQSTLRTEQQIAELREEVQHLREEQEQQKRQHANGDGHKENGSQGEQQPNRSEEDRAAPPKKHRLRKGIIAVVVLIILVAGVLWWLHERNYESTDDAQVDAHISGVAARISGTITGVYAEQDQFVKAGEVLVDLDPTDYKTALQQAQAQLAQAQNQTVAEQPNIPVTQVTNATNIATTKSEVTAAEAAAAAAERNYEASLAKVVEAEATNAKAQADVERYRPLVDKDEVPREQFDQVLATAKADAAMVAASQASAEASRKQVDQSRAQLTQAQQRAQEAVTNAPRQVAIRRADVASRQSAVQAARAQVAQALLNLSYTKIITPVGGIVAKRMAEVGQDVSPGQQVFLVTQIDDLWVTANFRETQLRRMRPGQSARIHVDALSQDYDGYVEYMPAASGSVTSLLPPENATGNFVKIVQRLPVRIRFKKNQGGLDRLRPGMSVEPKVALQ